MDFDLAPSATEREVMLSLFRRFGDDEEAVCLAYIEAERSCEVKRDSNVNSMTPGPYARTLWRDGKARGWLV
jgi:hypothetical protein